MLPSSVGPCRGPRWAVRQGLAPAVVLGAGQSGPDGASAAMPVRRRTSGGGAVLDGPWLLHAAVWLPPAHPVAREGLTAAARWFGALHAAWLAEGGIDGATPYCGPTLGHWACFAGRGPGEVLIGNRKVVGIAQTRRRSGALLVAGTLLESPPWAQLCAALGRPPGAVQELAGATLSVSDCLRQRPDAAAWAARLHARIGAALGR